jgi:hypothetical protein
MPYIDTTNLLPGATSSTKGKAGARARSRGGTVRNMGGGDAAQESLLAQQVWIHEQCSFLRLCHQQYDARPWQSTFVVLLTSALQLGDVVEAERVAGGCTVCCAVVL